jgi:hypothetical protein
MTLQVLVPGVIHFSIECNSIELEYFLQLDASGEGNGFTEEEISEEEISEDENSFGVVSRQLDYLTSLFLDGFCLPCQATTGPNLAFFGEAWVFLPADPIDVVG